MYYYATQLFTHLYIPTTLGNARARTMPGVNHLAPRGFSWPGAALVVGADCRYRLQQALELWL
jgi:hypothetical protein